jgi:ribosomal protein S18 acetylase RimI-like enzyme
VLKSSHSPKRAEDIRAVRVENLRLQSGHSLYFERCHLPFGGWGQYEEAKPVKIRSARPGDEEGLIPLIGEFRVTLARLRGVTQEMDLEAAEKELAGYREVSFPVFVAENGDGKIVGYLVCRVDGDVVWAESLFVSPESRRRGIGSALYAEAERLAQELGNDSVYNWVHPNNDTIISFLQNRGYSVLNLIELRRPRPGEKTKQQISVGKHEFEY